MFMVPSHCHLLFLISVLTIARFIGSTWFSPSLYPFFECLTICLPHVSEYCLVPFVCLKHWFLIKKQTSKQTKNCFGRRDVMESHGKQAGNGLIYLTKQLRNKY